MKRAATGVAFAILVLSLACLVVVGVFTVQSYLARRDFDARWQPTRERQDREYRETMKRFCKSYGEWADWARAHKLETSPAMDQRCANG